MLSACKNFGELDIGEWAAQKALDINPHDVTVYIMLANLYGHTDKPDKQAQVWKKIEQKGLGKIPGLAYIEIEGEIHELLVDDNKHPLIENIKKKLEKEKREIEKIGYKANVACVLKPNIPQDQKIGHLWLHSEKLAVGLGLLKLPPNSTITIHNNLHSCEDCHEALKAMTVTTKRTIILRDANRFHHVKNGKCSCNGYLFARLARRCCACVYASVFVRAQVCLCVHERIRMVMIFLKGEILRKYTLAHAPPSGKTIAVVALGAHFVIHDMTIQKRRGK